MASIALTIAASSIQSAWVYPATIAAAAVGSYIDRAVFLRPKDQHIEGPAIHDIPTQISSYGAPISKLYGAMRVPGNVIWKGERKIVKSVTEEERGKGGGGSVSTTTSAVFQSFATMVCEGEADAVLKIYADTKLIWTSSGTDEEVTQIDDFYFRFYPGSTTQEPDSWIEAEKGVGEVPAYRGRAYIVFKELPLEKFGNRIPNITAVVAKNVTNTLPDFDFTEVTATDSDNMRMHPDGYHGIIVKNNVWERFIPISRDLVMTRDHSTVTGTLDHIPFDSGSKPCTFDFDEDGNIWTAGEVTSSIWHRTKLDGETFEVLDTVSAGVGGPTLQPEKCYVFKNQPYVAYLLNSAGRIYIYDKDLTNTNRFLLISGIIEPQIYVDMCIDNVRNTLYLLSTSSSSDESFISKLQLPGTLSASATIYDYNVTFTQISSSSFSGCTNICYDEETDQLFVRGSANEIGIFDRETLTQLAELTNAAPFYSDSMFMQGPVDGFFYGALAPRTIKRINVSDYSVETFTTDDTGINIAGRSMFDKVTNSIICDSGNSGETLKKILMDRYSSADATLSDIYEDVIDAVGLDSATQSTTTSVSGMTVPGYIINSRMPGRSAIQPLSDAYLVDAVDSDGKIKFVARTGTASSIFIQESELAAHPFGEERPPKVAITRIPDIELPVHIDIHYVDKDHRYNAGVQSESRQTVNTTNMVSFRFPIAWSANQARQVAEKIMMSTWLGRDSVMFYVGQKYFRIEPTDVVTIQNRTGEKDLVVRVQQVDYLGGVMRIIGSLDSAVAYTSSATGYTPSATDKVFFPGPTQYALIDAPLLSAKIGTDKPGLYIAGQGYTDKWDGAQILRGRTSSSVALRMDNWGTIKSAAKMGRVITAPGAPSSSVNCWDNANSVVLMPYPNTVLSSASESEVLDGANRFSLVDPDNTYVEIMAYKTATLNADGSYTLTGLLRGLYGTDWATGMHKAGSFFVQGDSDTVTFSEVNEADYGLTNYFRGVSFNSRVSPKEVLVRSIPLYFRNLMPFAPQHLEGVRDGSNDLTISWIPSGRVGFEWADNVDGVYAGDFPEEYELDLYSSSTLLRTVTVTNDTEYVYDATTQTNDGITPGDPVDVYVYQISDTLSDLDGGSGRGFGRYEQL